jgi:hypothetical protein
MLFFVFGETSAWVAVEAHRFFHFQLAVGIRSRWALQFGVSKMGKRVAIVIAVENYSDSRIKKVSYAEADVKGFADGFIRWAVLRERPWIRFFPNSNSSRDAPDIFVSAWPMRSARRSRLLRRRSP